MKTPPRILQIGFGHIGQLYGQAFQAHNALAGLVVATHQSATRLRSKLSLSAQTDLERGFNEVSPNAIAIMAPTETREEHIQFCVEKAIPTLIVKPLACNLEGAKKILTIAKPTMNFLMGHEVIFAPGFLSMEAYIEEGSLGDIQELTIHHAGEPLYRLDGASQAQKQLSADFVVETVTHDLYTLNRLAGGESAPDQLHVKHLEGDLLNPSLHVELAYPCGVDAKILYDPKSNPGYRRLIRVRGTHGLIQWAIGPGLNKVSLKKDGSWYRLPFSCAQGGNPTLPVAEAFLKQISEGSAPRESLNAGQQAQEAADRLINAINGYLA